MEQDTKKAVRSEQIKCPKCNAINNATSQKCNICKQPLNIRDKDIHFSLDRKFTKFRSQSIHLFIGLIFGILFTYLVYLFVGFSPKSLFYLILSPSGAQIILPVAIVGLTFWPLTVILIRLLFIAWDSLRFSESISENLHDILLLRESEDSTSFSRKIVAITPSLNPYSISRILITKELLKRQGTQEELERHLAIEDDLEDSEIQGNYSIINLFISILPILGFLGTVIGITLAVDRFSVFLSGNINDVDLIKLQLGKVTEGLSFAFGTTILGLAGALILMLITTLTQNYEYSLCTRIRRFSVKHLLSIVHKNNVFK